MAYRATTIGALDSDALRSGRPLGAHLLRTIAGQSNLHRDLPSLMSTVAMDAITTNDYGAEYRLRASDEWRLVMPWRCPRRPGWNKVQVRISARSIANSSVEFGFVFGGRGIDTIQTVTMTGNGSVQVLSGELDLPLGGETERVDLYVRGRALEGTALSGTVGTPVSWSGNTDLRFGALVYTGAQTWDFDVLGSGTYGIALTTSGGRIIFQRRIRVAYERPGGDGFIMWSPGNMQRNPGMLSRAEFDDALANGDTYTLFVDNRVADLFSVMLLGGDI